MKVNVIKENDKITVQAPKGARAWKWFSNLGGVVNDATGKWEFPNDDDILEGILNCLKKHYGYIHTNDVADVRVTALKEVKSYKSAVCLGGFILCSSFGKNTTSRVGENVFLIDGTISGDGNAPNSYSVVDKGAIFKIKNFPKSLALEVNEDFKIEILEKQSVDYRTRGLKLLEDSLVLLEKGGVDITPVKIFLENEEGK
ncbi:hypothetical protein [Campylobacter fetus]|uniref:hypothetical protein n=1 Tax=Campylobacter fetus TaxID=196 RepID=UPI0013D2035C|nr:hypothetical protein [Campylobacter fetus]